MNFKRVSQAGWLAWMILVAGTSFLSAAERLQTLKGHVSKQIQSSVQMGRVPLDEPVQLSLVVQLDKDLMDQTLEQLYGPHAKQPKHFLSSAEFAQKFGLADKRKKLKDFVQLNGLTVDPAEDRSESMVLKVSGSARQVEQVFHIQLNRYRRPDGQMFRAHETEPMIPTALASDLAAILGLSNLTGVAHPHFRIGRSLSGASTAAASIVPKFVGTGPGATVAPSDIKTIYGITQASQDGTGQNVAIFELDGYNPTDITAYQTNFGLTHTPLTYVGVDGQANLCGVNRNLACNGATLATGGPSGGREDGMIEVALDIELVSALAPNASRIYVYNAPNSFAGVVDEYDRIATDNLAPVLSVSWGLFELAAGSAFVTAEAPIFQRMAAQGQAIFAATGDLGAFDDGSSLSVDDPASQPFVTGVGGTSLTGTPAAHTETAWNDGGGGVSEVWTIPSYQSGVPGLASQQFRNVPDVSLNADPASGYAVYVGGGFLGFAIGGTSAAAPLWAALMTLVNQQRVALGNAVLGFPNQALYQIGTSGSYSSFFNDIVLGDNQHYFAGAGYDNATGLGSYKGSALIGALETVQSFSTLDNLSSVYAYPNPWDVRRHNQRQMTFANLPDDASVKIFTISGFLVKTVSVDNTNAVWDLTNDSGRPVASGLYLYLVTHHDKKVIGKVAIIK